MISLVPGVLLLAQLQTSAVPAISIKPANAILPEEFARVAGIRELSDGRLVIGDFLPVAARHSNRVVVADKLLSKVAPTDGTADGLRGSVLWGIGGDSTIVKQLFSEKWHLYVGSRFVSTATIPSPGILQIGSDPNGGSGSPALVFLTITKIVGSTILDSNALVRQFAKSTVTDSIATLASRYGGPTEVTFGQVGAPPPTGNTRWRIQIVSGDYSRVFPDGWIAIARANPYRVDWCAPHKACTKGPLLPEQPAATTEADKQIYLDYSVKSAGTPGTNDVAKTVNWPGKLPPFAELPSSGEGTPLLAMPDGLLLVERLPSAAHPQRFYDVIDRRGLLVNTITLPLNQRIVGFGSTSVYITVQDESMKERITRHPWP